MSFQTLAEDELAQRLVFNLRLPRLITALLLGMSLSAAGNVFQMIFSNPLVEPGFLGVSQGAAFGAAFSIILLGGSAAATQSMALVFAFIGLGSSYLLARRIRFGGWVLRLVLSGIVISALFSSGLGVLKYMADPLSQLPEITFWLLGSLAHITWPDVYSILVPVLLGLFIIYRMRWRLNLLSLDDTISFSLGITPGRERTLLLIAAVAVTAAVVSVAGMVGWVGLMVPHLARRLFGSNARYTTPGSMLIGGTFVVLGDDIARTLLTGEIPLGILTSLIGALLFIVLMVSRNMRVNP
ncbi:MAG: iron ABC transporter permease [Anaerolineaceae bacterium]|nr:iron ABC transporter permease [Anaerolineaceae bacterium]